jgi:hypothetical protein
VANQGKRTDGMMLNLKLLILFAFFIAVSQSHFAEWASQNQNYFKKLRRHGRYNTIMYIDWVVCVGSAKDTI